MVGVAHVDNIDLTELVRWSKRVRNLALALILLLMLALFVDFHRAGMIYARASLLPAYLLFLVAAYAVCLFVECLPLWWGHEKGFYCARTLVHAGALATVVYVMGAFFIAGGAANVGVADGTAAAQAVSAAGGAADLRRSFAQLPPSF